MPSLHLPLALTALAALLTPTASSHLPLPSKTAPNFPFSQVHPLPTRGPSPDLLARQASSSTSVETVLAAPDNICGYISGRPGASFFCPADNSCFFFTAKATATGQVVCCDVNNCQARLACMDYDDVNTRSRCDGGCMVDAFTLKCTDSSLPFCNTASFTSDIYDYWCNNANISTVQSASTAYSGQSSDRRFSPVALTGVSSATGSRTIQAGPSASDGEDPGEGEEEEGEGEGEGEEGGGGGGGGGGKKTNAGAIAGGVVGGVAVIGLVAVAIIFILRRKKSQAAPAAAATPSTPATAMPHPPPPGWTQPPAAGYQGGYPASPEGYKPENAYYAQPQGQGLVPGQGVDRNSSTSPGGSTVVGSPTQGYGHQQFQGPEGHQQFQGPEGQQQGGQARPLHELGS